MDRFYDQFNIGKIVGKQDQSEGPKLTYAQIHEIGVRAVEKALEPQSDAPRPWAELVIADLPDNQRRLANVA
jgi:hypothetical protein